MAVDPATCRTFRRGAVDEPGLGVYLPGRRAQFSLSQGIEQITREDDPLSLSASEPFAGKMFDATIHRLPNLRAKTPSA